MISLLNFYILVLVFMVLIVVWTTYVDMDCVMVGGMPIGTLSKRSVRVYHLFIFGHLIISLDTNSYFT